ncbi:hypothetical protein R6Q59_016836 [Mikania micrantha]
MEEEEDKRKHLEISGGDANVQVGRGSGVDLRVETSDSGPIDMIKSNIADYVGRVDYESGCVDDGMFEQVSLDIEELVGDSDSGNVGDLNNLENSPDGNEEKLGLSVKGGYVESDSSPVVVKKHHESNISSHGLRGNSPNLSEKSSARNSYDSPLYAYGNEGHSPVGSPLKSKPKPMPKVSPELLHLVDSVITGKPESMEKLKKIVSGVESFGNGEEAESIALLVVDSLLATMGGVESFEEDEDNNPPSVMLNSRAAVVSGELIPWLPWLGDSVGMLRRPAEVLGQVHVATRMRPAEALWALAYGGPMSLLPFVVSKVDNNSLEPEKGDLTLSLATTALAAPIFRIISLAIQHPGNNNELYRTRGPEVLSIILTYLLQTLSSLDAAMHGVAHEEIVAAIVSLCQSQKNNYALKVQLFSTLLLDLKIWSLCSYGLQKKLLSSLADMVFTESSVMRDAKAIQTLLDGCRRCYWTIREKDSVNAFSLNGPTRPIGEVNALVDELLVVIELLVVAAPPSMAGDDIRCLLGFLVDSPQPNQSGFHAPQDLTRNIHGLVEVGDSMYALEKAFQAAPNRLMTGNTYMALLAASLPIFPVWVGFFCVYHDIEATIHCAEWLSMVGGSSTGEQRKRREETLPIFKRRLLCGLLDFAARELQVQTQVIAAAAAGVATYGLSPENSKAEAENAAQLSVALVENAIVVLMLVEDHLRLQSKLFSFSLVQAGSDSSLSSVVRVSSSKNFPKIPEPLEAHSSSADSRSLPLDVLASMADTKGQISATVMERLTAAAAAEPYDSVSCAFVSYGSCALDLAEGWKYRSRLWYGVGLPSKTSDFGGGGSGWAAWNSSLEKDSNGNWIELPLINKCVSMLQALLLDESGLGGGLGIGGGSGTGMGGMSALYQLLDSDQPFLCMLRMILVSMREEDDGENKMLMRNVSGIDEMSLKGSHGQDGSVLSSLENSPRTSMRQPRSALLWSVLSPLLHMPISESKRQRVLVASAVIYSEVWHAVSRDRVPLRKQYLEAILPPFVSVLRRWRPYLAGIHELVSTDVLNPFAVDDPALAGDALPIEGALAMISPGWAAAFASPPAALALAMIAAGAGGGEATAPATSMHLKRDSSSIDRKPKLHSFSSFHEPVGAVNKSSAVKDKAAAKAAALAAARDLERTAKVGSGRGLSAVAMATAAQRRNRSDMDRVKRWNVSEAMGTAWTECLPSTDNKPVYKKDFNVASYKFIAVLVGSLALARNMQRSEVDRRAQVDSIARHRACTGIRAWRKLIHYLVETKCLFGPIRENLNNPKQIFWKLDHMESSTRMRRCLRRNFEGSDHFGAAANYEDPVDPKHDKENATSPSKASVLPKEAISMELVNDDDEQDDIDNMETKKDGMGQIDDVQTRLSGTTEQPLQVPDSTKSHVGNDEDFVSSSAAGPGYIPSEDDERVILELSASMVRPLKVWQGTFQITTRKINFLLNKSEGNTPEDGLDRRIENRVEDKDRSWLMSCLHQVYSRRYLLRRSALELFMVDRSNFFFDFGTTEGRRSAYRAIVQARPSHLNNIYLATQRPEQLLKRTQLMERWARWEISNFEYLMQLNTLAGRSYNDITQYPVFPWILADYKSKHLDLANPLSYRDLSKPVGALNDERLQKFQERYYSFSDTVIPKFHYGSHYSSAGTVLYYLMRVEPFTALSIQLQGGKFDHADRMFSDISATWNGVLEDMSDVKELVPELFYLPEILLNENSIDFGTTQLGDKLDCVKLPPWAENAVDFVHKHRMALESEHVSAHLHEWIDLIFGYKQRGKEAISANNVFFYITYEGTVDIDKIMDPVQQRAMQDQIAYFGQTPSQLLITPHIKKMPLLDVLHMQTIFRNPKEVKPYSVESPERCNLPASAIRASSDSLVVVDMEAPAAHIAQHKWQPNTPDGKGTPFLFQHAKAIASTSSGTFMRMFKGPSGSSGSEDCHYPQALAYPAPGLWSSSIVSITYDNEIITGGHVDNSVRLISSDGAKTLEIARGHSAPVTCMSLSTDSNYLVTGSRDTIVLVWRIHQTGASRSSISEPPSTSGKSSSANSNSTNKNSLPDKNRKRRIEGPVQVIRGHFGEVICCCVDSDLGVVASCSDSSDVLLHSVSRGRLLRRLEGVKAHMICLSPDGVVITWNKLLHTLLTHTINGMMISRAYFPLSCSVSCMEVSSDGQSLLIGLNPCSEHNDVSRNKSKKEESEGGDVSNDDVGIERLEISFPSICFLDLHSLKVYHILELKKGQDITTLAVNKDNTNLLVSTADKQLIVFTDPALSLKVVDQMLKLGWEGDGLSPFMK